MFFALTQKRLRNCGLGLWGLGLVFCLESGAAAAIFSPSQADFLNLAFADFIDNVNPDTAALNSKTASGTDAAILNFTTDLDFNDGLFRVAMEAPLVADFTGLDAFSIDFSMPTIPAGSGYTGGIRAQAFVRSDAGSRFTGAGGINVPTSGKGTITLPISSIISNGGNPADITNFGIEFFTGDEFAGAALNGATVKVSTSPQPPTLVDHLISSFETDLEGWGEGIVPGAHAHARVVGTGNTAGNAAMEITRNYTAPGATSNFVWGTDLALDANAGVVNPTGDYSNNTAVDAADYTRWRDANGTATVLPNDPVGGTIGATQYNNWKNNFNQTGGPNQAVLAQIQDLVSRINDPNSYSLAFDLTTVDAFPGANPGYAIFHMAIAGDDGNAATPGGWFYQIDPGVVPLNFSLGTQTQTVELPLSQFTDRALGNNSPLKTTGIDPNSQYLTLHLASNTSVLANDFKFYIDNVRLRSIAPAGASSAAAAVPESASLLVALIGITLAAARRRT